MVRKELAIVTESVTPCYTLQSDERRGNMITGGNVAWIAIFFWS